MQYIIHIISTGFIAGLVSEGISISSKWNPDIQTEWLCWCGLFILLRILRYQSSGDSGSSSGSLIAKECGNHVGGSMVASTLEWKTWVVALCLSISRILELFYEVNWSLPFVTSIVYCFSLQYSMTSEHSLPAPSQTASRSFNMEISWLLRLKAPIMAALGICASALLINTSFLNSISYAACVGFIVLRSTGFILLSETRDFGIHSDKEQGIRLNAISLEGLVLRVLIITTIFMLLLHDQLRFSLAIAGQAIFLAVETLAVLLMVVFGYGVSSTTLDTFSVTTIQSLVGVVPQALAVSTVSFVSIVQCILGLPPSTQHQKVFIVFIILPVFVGIFRSICPSLQWIENIPTTAQPAAHPIEQLALEADAAFNDMLSKQSQNLPDAIDEYVRRYNRDPPPHFDKWFEAALKQNFALIDEFDIMTKGIEPFWGVTPEDLRGRVNSALAADQGSLIRFDVINHEVSYSKEDIDNEWVASQVQGWLTKDMLDTLPNTTFAINSFDEPKIVVPHDILEAALERARNNEVLQPSKNLELAQSVNFLSVGQQNPWDDMILSCPVGSPARQFYKQPLSTYSISNFGFLSNVSVSQDICLIPELQDLQGFLMNPETLRLTHSLVPIFSTAKLSSFQDVLYPAPWYDAKKSDYSEHEDIDWEEKEDTLYWVGSTTGGHATNSNWELFQRQRLVLMAMNDDQSIQLMKKVKLSELDNNETGVYKWQPYNTTVAEISSLLKVRISAVIQCDNDACNDQEAIFNISDHRDTINAGSLSRYNLDLDGNGLSGRFYRLLRSKSAVLKQTILQEWHDDWLIPWFHYIPVNMNLTDLPEIIRYLTHEPEGKELGKKVASNSREWMKKAFRRKDFKLAFWRLLLEYRRVMHDDRDNMKCC